MLHTLQRHGLIIPTLLTLAGITVLLSLGTWQLQRRAWKLELIQQVADRTKAEPVSIADVLTLFNAGENIDHIRAHVAGEFDHSKERHLFTVEKGVAGWRIFAPLTLANGTILFVDRGFVPAGLKQKNTRPDGTARTIVNLIGLARLPSLKGYWAPDNQPQKNEFYWRSLREMAESVGVKSPDGHLPFFLETERQQPESGKWPKPGIPRLTIPNRHLEYALTWFSLAIVLLCIYALFIRTRLQRTR